jgi:hypothetical protein
VHFHAQVVDVFINISYIKSRGGFWEQGRLPGGRGRERQGKLLGAGGASGSRE